MPPRKSVSRGSRRSLRGGDAPPADTQSPPPPAPASASTEPTSAAPAAPIASSSKVTLDMAPAVHDSITHDYVPPKLVPQVFTEVDKERLIMGFAPFNVLHDISEHARNLIYPTVASVDEWARKMAGDNVEMEHEIDMGSVALETLLESQVDRAFDRFTAYALRNSFKIPDDVEIVLPWQAGADFTRAKFVTSLPDGEGTLLSRLTALRHQVEQARLVRHRLAVAEAALDRKLALAAQRRAQVGFVRDGIAEADLHPLPEKATSIMQSMTGIHQQIADLEIPVSARTVTRDTEGAWESGRQAYLSWAVGRALAPEGSLRTVESETKAVGSAEEMAALAKIVK